jgi:hypothetical protein
MNLFLWIKPVFIIGQCIRVLNTDPWEAPTYKIFTVGGYSYEVIRVYNSGETALNTEGIRFSSQDEYENVKCPGETNDK